MATHRQGIAAALIIGMIRLYRMSFGAWLKGQCRFEPTCSLYAIEAVKQYGSLKGCYWAVRRLLRCHPWHPGGIDRVT